MNTGSCRKALRNVPYFASRRTSASTLVTPAVRSASSASVLVTKSRSLSSVFNGTFDPFASIAFARRASWSAASNVITPKFGSSGTFTPSAAGGTKPDRLNSPSFCVGGRTGFGGAFFGSARAEETTARQRKSRLFLILPIIAI